MHIYIYMYICITEIMCFTETEMSYKLRCKLQDNTCIPSANVLAQNFFASYRHAYMNVCVCVCGVCVCGCSKD